MASSISTRSTRSRSPLVAAAPTSGSKPSSVAPPSAKRGAKAATTAAAKPPAAIFESEAEDLDFETDEDLDGDLLAPDTAVGRAKTSRRIAPLPDGARQDETTGGYVHDASTLGDKALAIRVAADDLRAWNELYKKWQQELTRYGLAQGWERELVDDLVQDTLVRAWQKRTSYNSQYPYRVWILTIFRRLAMTHYRRVKTHDKTVEEQPTANLDTPWWQEGHTSMGKELGEQDVRSLLGPILADLRPEDRRLLEAWSHDECQADLARTLGVNPVTLRTQILRAKQRMSKAFAKRYPHLVTAGWGDTGGSMDD